VRKNLSNGHLQENVDVILFAQEANESTNCWDRKTLTCSHLDKPIIGDDLYSLDAGKKSINICNFIWQINLKIIDIQ